MSLAEDVAAVCVRACVCVKGSCVPYMTSDSNTHPVPLLLALQHPHLLLQPLTLPLQFLFPLTSPLGLVACALELRLQLLELQVRQGVQATGALKGQGRTVQHCGREQQMFFHCLPPDPCAISVCQQRLYGSAGA